MNKVGKLTDDFNICSKDINVRALTYFGIFDSRVKFDSRRTLELTYVYAVVTS